MATKSKNIYAPYSSKYYYNLSITATEQTLTNEEKEKNVSRVKVTGTLTSNGINFAGSTNQELAIYWFDNYKNTAGTKLSSFSFSSIDLNGKQNLTITKEIPHNPDGSLKGYAKVVFTKSGTNSYVPPTSEVQTDEFSLTTIPRATTPELSKESCTLGETITITLDRAVSSFTHDLYYKVGTSANTRFGDNVGDSMDWEVPLSLANWITENTSGTVTITCDTYNGSTLIGSKTVNLDVDIPSSITPKITSFEVSEATEGLAEKFGVYVKNKSTVRVKTTAQGSYSSTIKSYSASVNGISYSGSDITSGVLNKAGVITVSASATDSRTRVASQGKTISVLDYYAPKIIDFTAQRCTSDGTLVNDNTGKYLKLNVNYDIAPVNNKNDKKVSVEYRVKGTENWSQLLVYTDAYNGGTTGREKITTTEFDVDKTYELRVLVTDYFTTEDNPQVMKIEVGTSYTLMNYHPSGTGIAFGKASEKEDAFEVDLSETILKDTQINGQLDIADNSGAVHTTIKDGSISHDGNATIKGTTNLQDVTTLDKRAVLKQGYRVQTLTGTHGSTGYVLACRLTILGTYQNQAITMKVLQRSREGELKIRFSGSSTKDPGLNLFFKTGTIKAYLVKNTTSIWDLYIQKSEAYDSIEIVELYRGNYTAISVEWMHGHASTLPSGYVEAVHENRYTTSEQVVGTWIDGKPLYRRAIAVTTVSGQATYDISSWNISTPVDVRGYVIKSGDHRPVNFSIRFSDTGTEYFIACFYASNKIYLQAHSSYAGYSGYVIVEYTKTTD